MEERRDQLQGGAGRNHGPRRRRLSSRDHVGKEQEVQIDEMEEFAAEGHGEVQVHEIEEEGHREMQEERQMVSPSSEEKDYYKESYIRMIIISQLYLGGAF